LNYQIPELEIEGAGSMNLACLEWLHEQAKKMESIVEVGSYKGRSTHALLTGCPGLVYAVDPWVTLDGAYRPGAFKTFLANVGYLRNLRVIQVGSPGAAGAFRNESIDMVFIDGDHSYEGVKADIKAWLPKTRKLICGHDYTPNTPGVGRAVNEFFPKQFTRLPGTSIWLVYLTTGGTK